MENATFGRVIGNDFLLPWETERFDVAQDFKWILIGARDRKSSETKRTHTCLCVNNFFVRELRSGSFTLSSRDSNKGNSTF